MRGYTKKASERFKSLSRIGKLSVISVLALGGLFATSAMTPRPETSRQEPKPMTVAESEKKPVVTTKVETETHKIAFEKQSVENGNLAKGQTNIQTAGVDGVKTVTHTITLTDGKETGRTTSETITTPPVAEVTVIGTYEAPKPQCDSNYSGCVPIVSYDLDCADIGYTVTVLGYDVHRLDRDKDGYGCE